MDVSFYERKSAPISKWSIFITDKDYSEEELISKFFSMGLIPATPSDLQEYMKSGWNWETNITAFDSEHERNGVKCLMGITSPQTVPKCLWWSEKPAIFPKRHWRFLLKNSLSPT